jgi:hypothetical protein
LHATGQDGKISIGELKQQAIELSATTIGNPDDLTKAGVVTVTSTPMARFSDEREPAIVGL